MKWFRFFAALAIMVSLGCESGQSVDTSGTLEVLPEIDRALDRFEGYSKVRPQHAQRYPDMLPSFRLPSEVSVPGKADQYSDYRAANPEWYAITIPPVEVSPEVQGMIEWEPMQALLLTASGNSLPDAVDQNLAEMTFGAVRTAGVDTYLLYSNSGHKAAVEGRLLDLGATAADMSKVHWLPIQHDSIWMIDYGPFPIRNSQETLAFVDFRYFNQRVLDDSVPTRLGYEEFGGDTFRMPLDFEGGNLQVDSQGTCYITQGVLWFNTLTQAQIEEVMQKYLGCDRTVIVAPLIDEGTTHIDMFFKLVDDHTVILGAYTEAQDAGNSALLDANQDILEAVQLPDGVPVTVHRMFLPSNGSCAKEMSGDVYRATPPVACDTSSECPWGYSCYPRLDWRTYINSTFVKGDAGAVNLWPTFSVQPDKQAQAKLLWETVMPGWTHQEVLSDTIITWNGAMHCISRTVPVGPISPWVQPGSCAAGTCVPTSSKGYSGSCAVETACSGPAWLCATNECEASQGCGDIQYQGCCEAGKLFYCEDEQIKVIQCQNQLCGWDGQNGFYNCGSSGAGPEAYPYECPAESCTPDCLGKTCGSDGCEGSCGVCGEGSSCVAGTCSCTPSCAGKECGDDGCGGSCGTCVTGNICVSGVCEEEVGGCQGLSYAGCCDEGLLRWCEEDEPKSLDCGGVDKCGWDSVPGYYNCGFDGEGPPEHPKACGVACSPDCGANTCGSDGCGGSCGSCEAGALCKDGSCISEEESCGGLTYAGCCTGSVLSWCDNGDPKTYDCGAEAGCGWNESYQYYDCGYTTAGPAEFPWACGGACSPDCAAKACGDDGCGGVCGQCSENLSCESGQCVCAPDCAGRSCGDDGCGGSCGQCTANESCTEGVCVGSSGGCGDVAAEGKCVGTTLFSCVGGEKLESVACPECCDWSAATMKYECVQCAGCRPNCAGKKCGDDGCGGVCGDCATGEICRDSLCECVPDCRGRECGDDGCRGSCGACMGDLQCTTSGLCVEAGDESLGQTGAHNEGGEAPSLEGARETEGGSSGSGCAVGSSPRGSSQTSIALLIMTLLAIYRRRRPQGC